MATRPDPELQALRDMLRNTHSALSDAVPAFTLTDAIVLLQLKRSSPLPYPPILRLHSSPDRTAFPQPQHPRLLCAIHLHQTDAALRLLEQLTAPLPTGDAIQACLCALSGSKRLMNALLDHCPPIPEFQFLGVGSAASLLGVAARYNKHQMLNLLLKRGADPNGGSTPETARPPIEEAFCHFAYESVDRLLNCPDLADIILTEEILATWGSFVSSYTPLPPHDAFSPELSRCCCKLLERITGQPCDPADLMPIPPQLRLKHTLQAENLMLAAKLCRTRPLSQEEKADLLAYYTRAQTGEFPHAVHKKLYSPQAESVFLDSLLETCPDLLHTPQLRSAIAALILKLPEPVLRRWADRMEPGPIRLPELLDDFIWPGFVHDRFGSITPLQPPPAPTIFSRWDDRLGRRLTPALDIHDPRLYGIYPDYVGLLLERVCFTGTPSPHKLSLLAEQALRFAPLAMLPELLKPDGLLGREYPACLLNTCQQLPTSRKNFLLAYLGKTVDYEL